LHPYDYVDYDPSRIPNDSEDDEPVRPALWELPDTSILFRRYLDSGKTINVYDWFESFAVVLENQRRHLKKQGEKGGSSSPRKSGSSPKKGKGKQRQVDISDDEDVRMDDGGGDDDEENEEKWKMEIQARFMRALQELDYLGFIKHTGRKADHVSRTIFDIPD
jgi:origin recognition complex subunit 3